MLTDLHTRFLSPQLLERLIGGDMDADDARQRLLKIVHERCFKMSDEPFILASGEESRYYVDGKQAGLNPEALLLYGVVLWDQIKNENFDCISGVETGSISLTAAGVIGCYLHGRVVEGVFVRRNRKDHGTRNMVEGPINKGNRVIVLDDVVTTGKSVLEAITWLEEKGAEVIKIVSLVDRRDSSKDPRLTEAYRYEWLISSDELHELEKGQNIRDTQMQAASGD